MKITSKKQERRAVVKSSSEEQEWAQGVRAGGKSRSAEQDLAA